MFTGIESTIIEIAAEIGVTLTTALFIGLGAAFTAIGAYFKGRK